MSEQQVQRWADEAEARYDIEELKHLGSHLRGTDRFSTIRDGDSRARWMGDANGYRDDDMTGIDLDPTDCNGPFDVIASATIGIAVHQQRP